MENSQVEHKAGLIERAILSPIFWVLAILMGVVIRIVGQAANPPLSENNLYGRETNGALIAIVLVLAIPLLLVLPIAVGIVLGSRRGRNRANGLPPGWKEPLLGSIGIILICGNLLSYLFYALSGLIAQRAAWKSGVRGREAAQAAESAKAERAALEEQFRSAA